MDLKSIVAKGEIACATMRFERCLLQDANMWR